MSVIKPRGDLFQLPRETRDQIYGEYFNGIYPVFRCYHVSEENASQDGTSQACLQHTSTDLAILQISKVLQNDVRQFFLSKAAAKAGTYKYAIDLDPHETISRPSFMGTTEHMMNVMFEVRIRPESTAASAKADRYESKTISNNSVTDSICEATIERFAGSANTADIRESFQITFMAYTTFEQSFGYFMKTRFFQALKVLTGFKTVTVILKWLVRSWCHSSVEVNEGVQEVRLELEPHLGPSKRKKHAAYYTGEFDEVTGAAKAHVVEMEFKPRQHHARISSRGCELDGGEWTEIQGLVPGELREKAHGCRRRPPGLRNESFEVAS